MTESSFEKITDLDDLKVAIQSIIVKDYGDFKRKAVLYINRYAENNNWGADKQNLYRNLIDHIQFNPNFDIERTRSWTLNQLNALT